MIAYAVALAAIVIASLAIGVPFGLFGGLGFLIVALAALGAVYLRTGSKDDRRTPQGQVHPWDIFP